MKKRMIKITASNLVNKGKQTTSAERLCKQNDGQAAEAAARPTPRTDMGQTSC
jgi:hypothetical protein